MVGRINGHWGKVVAPRKGVKAMVLAVDLARGRG